MTSSTSGLGVIKVEVTEAHLDAVLGQIVLTSLQKGNLVEASDIDKLPNEAGHYAILSDKPAPYSVHGEDLDEVNGLHVLYNGSSQSIKARVQQHLRVPYSSRSNSGSGLPYNTQTEQKFQSLLEDGTIDPTMQVYHKKGTDKDGKSIRYMNGIDHRSPQFADTKFYIAHSVSQHYGGATEQVFRKIIGQPPLCRTKSR